MKLTKRQKARLIEYDWDVIETDVDGETQNCAWISFTPEDGSVFGEVVEMFGLTGNASSVQLLVVATSEDKECEKEISD